MGEPNGVELTIEHHDTGEPYEDLGAGDMTVVVSTAGAETEALALEPAFGQPGVYTADLLPTAPGEYTFHFVGNIGDTPVDVEMTSGDDTFSGVLSPADVEFPVKVPTMAEVATRLDRIDGRIEDLPDQAALDAANARADAAVASANQAMTMGLLVGGAGLVVALVALVVGWRAGRGSTARP